MKVLEQFLHSRRRLNCCNHPNGSEITSFSQPKGAILNVSHIIFADCSNLDQDEIDMVYAERNVLHEEATTVEAETITVDRFRQRFCNTNLSERSQSSFGIENNEDHPKYKAPPPPPRQRRTSSSSTIIKVSLVKFAPFHGIS